MFTVIIFYMKYAFALYSTYFYAPTVVALRVSQLNISKTMICMSLDRKFKFIDFEVLDDVTQRYKSDRKK